MFANPRVTVASYPGVDGTPASSSESVRSVVSGNITIKTYGGAAGGAEKAANATAKHRAAEKERASTPNAAQEKYERDFFVMLEQK